MEFQHMIDDFDISLLNKYSKELDNINNNKYIYNNTILSRSNNSPKNLKELNKLEKNMEFNNNLFNKNNDKTITINILEDGNNLNEKRNLFSELKSREMSNSSHNYFIESNNSKFPKDKLSNNSLINSSKDFLMNYSKDYPNNKMKDMNNNTIRNNNLKETESFEKEDYQNIIINKSNKALVFVIIIFFMILFIIIFSIIIFISYKFKYILSFNQKFNRYFHDLSVLSYRYSIIYYYYNTLRILIVLPEISTSKIIYSNSMENINEIYEIENKKYIDILSSNIRDYKEVNKLFNIYKETSEDKFEEIKQKICNKLEFCENFVESNKNFLVQELILLLKQ